MLKIFNKLLSILPFKRFRNPKPVVSIVRLNGIIGGMGGIRKGLTIADLAPVLDKAFSLNNLSAVALVINSPGGSPVQSALIAERIRSLAKKNNIEVWAFCEDVAASGGYWLALSADHIYALNTSILGSIGVVSGGFGFSEAIKKIGIERRLYTAGTKKAILDPFLPEKESEVKHLKAIQSDIYEEFKTEVKSRRNTKLKGKEPELFSGAFWTGRRAIEMGLIDGIGDLYSVMNEHFNERLKLKEIAPRKSFFRDVFKVHSIENHEVTLINGILGAIENRLMWNKFGL